MYTNADVRGDLSRASAGDAEFQLYMAEARAELAYEEAGAEVRWHEAVRDELVACTLGARRRPELRTDPAGRVGYLIGQGIVHMQTTLQAGAKALLAELTAYQYPRAR